MTRNIAIIGRSCALPGRKDDRSFWDGLCKGVDFISEIPADRWDWRQYYGDPKQQPNTSLSKWGGFLDGIRSFDAAFFQISAREAELADPQQRIALELTWQALEDAGCAPHRLAGGDTGVFVGACNSDYKSLMEADGSRLNGHMATGMHPSLIANRISYFFNLHGPSFTVDTACSSSLVALHQAVRAIRGGECGMAIVCGVNALSLPTTFSSLSDAGMLSPSGHCRSFGDGADGYVRGEGAGVLILKGLAAALRDGDRVHAVIKGSAVNHGGRASTLTAPNPYAQARVVQSAIEDAGIAAQTITYVEAHGTGTPLGDPIEVQGLVRAFRQAGAGADTRPAQPYCGIGAIKSNIGHLEGAAGVAGVVKVLLALQYKQLPPLANFERVNSRIRLEGTPFYLLDQLREWTTICDDKGAPLPRRAGVSSFGFGGANAHVILEEFVSPPEVRDPVPAVDELVVLSARTSERLHALLRNLVSFIEGHQGRGDALPEFADAAYTLQVGREPLAERIAFVASNWEALLGLLQGCLAGKEGAEVVRSSTSGAIPADLLPGDCAEGRDYVDALYRNRRLKKIAALWVSVADVDWERLRGERPARKVSLPGTPFLRQSHWLSANPQPFRPASVPDEIEARLSGATQPQVAQGLFAKVWQRRPLPAGRPAARMDRAAFVVRGPTASSWAQALRERYGASVVIVGDTPQADVMVDWRSLDACRAAGDSLLTQRPGIELFVDLCDITETRGDGIDGELDARLGLLQVVLGARRSSDFVLLHVTRGLHPCGGTSPVRQPQAACVAGIVRAVQAEVPGLVSRTVDMDAATGPDDAVLERVALEAATPAGEVEACWRGDERYAPKWKLQGPASAVPQVTVRPDRQYLITGGTGGVGLVCADYLVSLGARKLILTGVTPLPERSEWPALVAAGTDASACRKIETILRLEARGVAVRLYIGPLHDDEALAAFLREAVQRDGPVGGVLQCAVKPFDGETPYFVNKSSGQLREAFMPKVRGTLNLVEALCAQPLDFFVLFSSVASAVAKLGVGNAHYAAANFAMDHLAAWLHGQGRREVRTINWVLWGEVGARRGDEHRKRLARFGMHPIDNSTAIAYLAQAIAGPVPQLMAGALDSALLGEVDERETPASHLPQAQQAVADAADQPSVAIDLRQDLRAILGRALGRDFLPDDDELSIAEFGADSIIVGEIVTGIERRFDVSINPATVFDRDTVAKLEQVLGPLLAGRPAAQGAERHVAASAKRAAVASLPVLANGAGARDNVIAVIGLDCQFPQARDKETYWANLVAGKDCITEVPPSRWSVGDLYGKDGSGGSISKWGGFIEGIEEFDAAYFDINPQDARQVDPLVRKFLEVGVGAFRDAGYERDDLAGSRTGVFVGARASNYLERVREPRKNTIVGNGQNFIAAHVSQFLDLQGPSLVIDSACSSSLVSLHMACRSLVAGDCDIALAGGVDVLLDERTYVLMTAAKALSPDGRCRAFDARANGFVPGEGAGAVVLKRLSRALADGDAILAMIDASAVNNDGHTMGVTTPNPEAQARLIETALKEGGIDPSSISCVEAHGTGTMIGDPIELKALNQVFRRRTSAKGFCAVGSVKSNIGHLLSAAGVASFIKVVLSLQRHQLPPTLHCEQPNPRFNFEDSPFYPNTRLRFWEPIGGVRRAAVSAFGLGGTSAHVIVSEFDASMHRGHVTRRRALPPAMFNRQRHWLDRAPADGVAPPCWFNLVRASQADDGRWSATIHHRDALVQDHRVHDVCVLPGAALVDLVCRGLRERDVVPLRLDKVLFRQPIVVDYNFDAEIRLAVEGDRISIENRQTLPDATWVHTAACEFERVQSSPAVERLDFDSVLRESHACTDVETLYAQARQMQLWHGDRMSVAGSVHHGPNGIVARLKLRSNDAAGQRHFVLHPVLLDAANLVAVLWLPNGQRLDQLFIPFGIERLDLWRPLSGPECFVRLSGAVSPPAANVDVIYRDFELYDTSGACVARVTRAAYKAVRHASTIIGLLSGADAAAGDPAAMPEEAPRVRMAPAASVPRLEGGSIGELERMVCEQLGRPIGSVDTHASFYALGMESIDLLKLTKRIEAHWDRELYPTLLFEYPSIGELAAYLGDCPSEGRDVEASSPAVPTVTPMSPMQQSLWLIQHLAPESTAYHIPNSYRFAKVATVAQVTAAVQGVVDQQPGLRTCFDGVAPHVRQRVLERYIVQPELIDVCGRSSAQIEAVLESEYRKPFDMSSASKPLLRVVLLEGDEHYYLLVTTHHVIFDGASVVLLKKQFTRCLGAVLAGQPVPDLGVQHTQREWVQAQGHYLQTQETEAARQYWMQQLADPPALLELPTDHARPSVRRFKGDVHRFDLSADEHQAVRALAQANGTTPYVVLLAVFQVMLRRYTQQSDLIVGSPVSGRNGRACEQAIGCFINMLPIRVQARSDLRFVDLLARASAAVRQGMQHKDFPVERMVEQLQLLRDGSHAPLFQADIVWQDWGGDLVSEGGTEPRVDWVFLREQEGQFDLTLELVAGNVPGLRVHLKYDIDLFLPSTIQRMARHYQRLVRSVSSDPQQTLDRLDMLAPDERRQLLIETNRTEAALPPIGGVHAAVTEQVRRTPEAIALVCGQRRLSYAQLEVQANQLAHHLLSRGAGPGRLVGVCMPRSAEMVVALLAVMKTGSAYVPLDPAFPPKRLQHMRDDACLHAVLTDRATAAAVGIVEGAVCVEDWPALLASQPRTAPAHAADPTQLAYVIYTSGSTGEPKGVMVTHGGVLNFFVGMDGVIGGVPGTLLAVTTISFDISVLELFWTLSRGFTVVVQGDTPDWMPSGAPDDPTLLAQLRRHGVTHLQCTPSLLTALLELPGAAGYLSTLRHLMLGGEPLSQALVQRVRAQLEVQLYNLYGPTETTIWSAAARVGTGVEPVSLGDPLVNTQLYVLNEALEPVPAGVPGELFIGGAGLASGYLNRPDLTSERFIADPFAAEGSARMYRTGDRARRGTDGQLQYLSRVDRQMKLRGRRLELGEIEVALERHPAIERAVVTVHRESNGAESLVAYFTARQGMSADEVRTFLRESLPDYMVPTFCVMLDEWPLTPNRKVDVRRLPPPVSSSRSMRSADELEQKIQAVWCSVLQREYVDIEASFFEIGGNSLLLVQLHARLQALFPDRAIRAVDLFTHPSVRRFAAYLATPSSHAAGRLPSEPTTPPAAAPGDPNLSLKERRQALRRRNPARMEF